MNGQKVSLLCLLMLLLFDVVADAKVVFSSRRDGVKGVYVMDDDGSNQTLLIEEGTGRSHTLLAGHPMVNRLRLRVSGVNT